MPVHLDSTLKERLQSSDKQTAIELFYELLSSGHSAGEILDAVNSVRNETEENDKSSPVYPEPKSDQGSPDVAAEIMSAKGADKHRTGERQATKSAPLDEQHSDDREQRGGICPEPVPDIPGPAGAQPAPRRENTHSPGSLETIRPGRFAGLSRPMVFAAIYVAMVSSAAVIGFSVIDAPQIRPTIARVKSGIFGGGKTLAMPPPEVDSPGVDSPEAAAATPDPKAQAVDADASPAPQPSRSVEPHPAVPGAAGTARAEPPDAARPHTGAATAAAEPPRIAGIPPEDPRFTKAATDALVTRGDAFFAAGDLASARLFYEYAATAGNGAAALRLGGTFDPGFLARARIGRVQGDTAIALYWYRRARTLGNRDAEILLQRMGNTVQ